MKKYKLIINPFAEQDLYDASEWYNLQKRDLGEKIIIEIKKTNKKSYSSQISLFNIFLYK